ncbi:hypothetical protein ACGFZK_35040, partial [Streptomyces sp. NPDC048257]|uniref:hypothetical protein n=1 Tax=Streptomyces sp. NPDC048257 TaxID=3365526 RepID=UPI00371AC3F1
MGRGRAVSGRAAGSVGKHSRSPPEGVEMRDLSNIVKAYDVRGVVPDEWDESLAELFGAAFV